ncbi:hypothetical protein WUBG_14802 [Wuchereria bancrofti]|uniref:Uncharacterized protein n=1 Tax=Wuchereria bancrofti TaxID=6293 RepID=J9AJB7_WUCBA|nr:hypothetical protein WUBG_14802 [Wuchereria bancrofti]
MQKNFNNSKEEEKFNDDEDDMNVSNADYFNAIIHAIIPGPLDIPSLYRTYTMLPLTNDRRKMIHSYHQQLKLINKHL